MNLIDPPSEADRLEISPDAIKELADSIAEVGLLSPILVSINGDRFEIVFGDRRHRAARSLGWTEIPACVVEYTPREISTVRATENLQRVDLTPIEEAHIYVRMINDLEMTIDNVAKNQGKSPGVVRRRLDLLRMPDSFIKALHAKKVSISVAEELWSCGDEGHREYLLEMAIEHGITHAIARQWVQDHKKSQRRNPGDIGGGGGHEQLTFEEKIFRSCDACRGPVDLSLVKELRLCPKCHAEITAALRGEK